MNLFCFLPPQVARRRLKLGVYLCAVFMATTMLGLAQSQSQSSSSDTTNSNDATPAINNPQNHNVSTGNYIPPPPPSGPDVYYNHRWDLYGGFAYTNFLAGPALIQRSNMGGWKRALPTGWDGIGVCWRTRANTSEPRAYTPTPRVKGSRRIAHRFRPPAITIAPSPGHASCSTTSWQVRSIECFVAPRPRAHSMRCSATRGEFSTLRHCTV